MADVILKEGAEFEDMDSREGRKRTVVIKKIEGAKITIANKETGRATTANAAAFYPRSHRKLTKGFREI